MKLYGSLEAGGTKMVCAIGDEQGNILERVSIPTLEPENTMPAIIEFFKNKNISALGIGCFGPVDLDKKSATYGYITTTPKLAWKNYDIVGTCKKELGVPVGFDTDVNASALGEATWGCTKELDHSIYITVGTGIGAGVIIDGKPYHGMLIPKPATFSWPAIPRIPWSGVSAPTMSCVWKVWPAAPPSRPVGVSPVWSWLTVRKSGSWRLTTWPRLSAATS